MPRRSRPARRAVCQAPQPRIQFAVIGINHEHIFRMTQAVTDGGGKLTLVHAPAAEPHLAEKFLREHPDVRKARSEEEVLEAPDVQLVISTSPPAERAHVGMRIMKAGKDFLADKGGFLNLEDIAEARRIQAETKRIYAISYSERLLEPSTVKAGELAQAGAIGRIVHTSAIGPHGLLSNPPSRGSGPAPAAAASSPTSGLTRPISFCFSLAPSTPASCSRAANYQNPDHPEFEDFGEVAFRSDDVSGYARVDYYRTQSLGASLTLMGTEGSMFVAKGSGHVQVSDRNGRREVRADIDKPCPFGRQLVDDVLNRTETAIGQEHAFLRVRAGRAGAAHGECVSYDMDPPPLDILYDDGPVLVVNKPAGLLTQAPAGIDSLEVRVKEFYRRREGKPDGRQHLSRPAAPARSAGVGRDRVRPARAGGAADLGAVRESHRREVVLGVRRRRRRRRTKATWTDYLHKRHGMAQAEVVAADHPAAKHRGAALPRAVAGRAPARGWRWSWRPAARTRFASRRRRAAMRWSATRSTAARSRSAIRRSTCAIAPSRCTRGSWRSAIR